MPTLPEHALGVVTRDVVAAVSRADLIEGGPPGRSGCTDNGGLTMGSLELSSRAHVQIMSLIVCSLVSQVARTAAGLSLAERLADRRVPNHGFSRRSHFSKRSRELSPA
jgi:hypothetical protein